MNYAILHGQVLEHLRTLETDSMDAMLCDPPYGLGSHQPTPAELLAYLGGSEMDTGGDFMGKDWHVPSVQVWREIFRVLKPGAPVMAFAGARTGDLISLGMRAAGFEVRDVIMWLYAKGFPKSQSTALALDKAAGAERPIVGTRVLTGNAAVSLKDKGGTYGVQVGTVPPKEVNVTGPATDAAKLWAGYGTALKPSYEPIILARKPLAGTMVDNVFAHGVGPINVDGCRIGEEEVTINTFDDGAKPFGGAEGCTYTGRQSVGRWPANTILDEEAGAFLDEQSGTRKSTPYRANVAGGAVLPLTKRTAGGYGDSGGASRFFFCPKVNTKEREKGCELLPERSAGEMTDRGAEEVALNSPRTGAGRTGGARNHHPTLKPIALIRYLATMILPPTPSAVLLVPYCGSGSEIIGALQAGWRGVLGIEREAEYIAIAEARIPAHVEGATHIRNNI